MVEMIPYGSRKRLPGVNPTGVRGRPILKQYGRWTLIERVGTRAQSPLWRCRCECGVERDVILRSLQRGASQSCGCYRKERTGEVARTHGATDTVEYRVWAGMMNRCHYARWGNGGGKHFAGYRGRGIIVCERWHKFENFLADMGARPSPKHSLDRIDNDGNYEPINCRWATASEQRRNQRRRISSKVKLAAALLMLGHIPYEDAKQMTADQIVSLYHFDHHPILYAHGGPDEPWNLTPRLIMEHRGKSKRDTAIAAKVKRLRAKAGLPAGLLDVVAAIDHQMPRHGFRKAAGKSFGRPWPKMRIPRRAHPWPPKGSRPFVVRKKHRTINRTER